LAIEEDKRRRNTAASARFRFKKKQREAALETTAKELRDRVQELEDENAKLKTELGWLRGLITNQGGATATMETGVEGVAVASVAAPHQPQPQSSRSSSLQQQQGRAPVHQPNGGSNQSSRISLERHSGLHPRGVGTGTAPAAVNSTPNHASNSNTRDVVLAVPPSTLTSAQIPAQPQGNRHVNGHVNNDAAPQQQPPTGSLGSAPSAPSTSFAPVAGKSEALVPIGSKRDRED
ncbi:hypothetical protein K437DRAFT_226706, partial [Tilletiaria anomala UBC 951]